MKACYYKHNISVVCKNMTFLFLPSLSIFADLFVALKHLFGGRLYVTNLIFYILWETLFSKII